MNRRLSFAAAAREAPDQLALWTEEGSWSFAELAPKVAQMGAWLLSQPWSSQRRRDALGVPNVALVGVNRLPQLVAVWALIEAKMPFQLIHPGWTAAERRRILERSPPALVIDEEWSLATQASSSCSEPSAKDTAEEWLESGESVSRTLAVLYTSGSTHRPKGAVLSREAFLASAEASEHNLGWLKEDSWLLNLPIAHIGGLSVLTRTLVARKALVVAPEGSFSCESFISMVEKRGVTLASLVPTQLHRLLKREPEWRPPSSLRAILLGGARASHSLLEKARTLGWPVLPTYGLTEACSQVATHSFDDEPGSGGIGPLLRNVELRISADRDRPDFDGEAGAIRIRGPMLFDGYLRGAKESPARGPEEETLDRSAFDSEGWFDTGDCGFIDRQGHLHVVDRRTDLIVTGGENVHPSEVEQALERRPEIEAACVFGVEDDEWGQQVAAAVVPTGGQKPEEGWLASELREGSLSRHLAKFKRPKLFIWLDEMPTSVSGKMDRSAVRAKALEGGLLSCAPKRPQTGAGSDGEDRS